MRDPLAQVFLAHGNGADSSNWTASALWNVAGMKVTNISGQTLFCVHGTTEATLVSNAGGKMRSSWRKFKEAREALEWCIANRVNLSLSFSAEEPAEIEPADNLITFAP